MVRLTWGRGSALPQLLEERDGGGALLRRYESDGGRVTRYRADPTRPAPTRPDPTGQVETLAELQTVAQAVTGLLTTTFFAFAGTSLAAGGPASLLSLGKALSGFWPTGLSGAVSLSGGAGATSYDASLAAGFEVLLNQSSSEAGLFGYFGPSVGSGNLTTPLSAGVAVAANAVFDTDTASNSGGFFWGLTANTASLANLAELAARGSGVKAAVGRVAALIRATDTRSIAWPPTPTFSSTGVNPFTRPPVVSADPAAGRARHSHTLGRSVAIGSSEPTGITLSVTHYVALAIYGSEATGLYQDLGWLS